MKSLILIIFILPILIHGQEIDAKIKLRINEINSLIKVSDSIGNIQKEGISEGEIRYNHISGNFGWEAYFLNDTKNKTQPLRIRYSDTQPKANENLNLYYKNGILIFAELITTPTGRKSKRNQPLSKTFYFENGDIIYPNTTDSDIDYIIQKEKTIYKMIYK